MLMNMKEILAPANEHNFAVPAFNVSSNMILKGVMHNCEEMQAPVIIAIHPDELSFVEDSFVKAVIEEAHKATVPVCIHLDHGSKFEQVLRAIQDGFTSVMIDGAHLPLEENIAITKKVVEVAHPVNVSVEAELGTIGTADDYGEAGSKEIIYTEVDDAVKFIKETDIDCLAIAIGTAHGLYPKDRKPKLALDRLQEIKANVSIPLVLHGGSGNPDEEIAQSVKLGVNKINISSDIKDAFYQNQSHWLERPMIHLLPHWTHPGLEGMLISVWAYTNCEEAELFLNGKSLGRVSIEPWGHAEWNVPYEPGRLEAVGFRKGRRCVSDFHETTGSPTALLLRLENAPVSANGEDVALFTCLALDEQGREVPDASPLVHFDCVGGGRILGTGSSNTDPVPVSSPERRMFAGRISIAVKPDQPANGESQVETVLLAGAEGLRSARLAVRFPAEAEAGARGGEKNG